MEIDQLTVTSITLTLRTKTFLHESDDLVPLDTPIIVFLDSVTVTVDLINDWSIVLTRTDYSTF